MINPKNIRNVRNKFWNYSFRDSTRANTLEPRLEFHATADPSWGSRMGEKIMFYRPSSRQCFLRYVESFEKKRGTDYDGW